MGYYLRLLLRIAGMVFLAIFLLDTARELGFVGATMRLPYMALAIGVTVLVVGGLLWWGYRVVWQPIAPVQISRSWQTVQWLLLAALTAFIAFSGWQGWQNATDFLTQTSPIGGSVGGVEGMTPVMTIGYKLSSAVIDTATVVIYLLIVSLVRMIVRRRRAFDRKAPAVGSVS